ncbi:hypothetical protein FRC05_001753 [Tulasnella sp. 425]|nr:hypothetical protein FRC05_001753 [Tulasnella sp. 425]
MATPSSPAPSSAAHDETVVYDRRSSVGAPTGGSISPFNVFAFSLPPPSQGRSGNDRGSTRNPTSADTGTGLPTPYSPPLLTPGEDQPLPLPLPFPGHPPSALGRESPLTTTGPRTMSSHNPFAYSQPPHQPERPNDDQTQSSGGTLPISSTEPASLVPTRDGPLPESDKEADLESSRDSDLPQDPNGGGFSQPENIPNVGQVDSPFAEVRACVSNTDDPDMPSMTFRMWFIGLTLCSIATALNMVLSLRFPGAFVNTLVILLVAYIMGKLMEFVLPIRLWFIPDVIPWIGGSTFTLNPGPFSIKEHSLIYTMSNGPITTPYGLNFVLVARKYYDVELSTGPTALIVSSMMNALHARNGDEQLRLTRIKFFSLFVGLSAVYYFIPGFLFTGLSYFSFICWIAPRNTVVNQLFGTVTGLGMGVLTFDWAQISFMGSPMLVPWWASVQAFAGFVLFYWVILPILYYTNTLKTGHLPIMGYVAYDRFGLPYDLDRILNPDKTFNAAAYAEYSPLYIPISLTTTYLVQFVLATAIVFSTVLDFGEELWKAFKKGPRPEDEDVHARLMRKYSEVPALWYAGVFVVSFALAAAAIQVFV